MASDALSQAWRFMVNDVYLRKAENEGVMTDDERRLLLEFVKLPIERDIITEFLDENFATDMHGDFDHFIYNLRHYDPSGELVYKPKKTSRLTEPRFADMVDYSEALHIPSFEEWEKQQKDTPRRFLTRADARRAYEKFKLETIRDKASATVGFTGNVGAKNGGLGNSVERVGEGDSIWELLTKKENEDMVNDYNPTPALRAIVMHQEKLGRQFYDRLQSTIHSEALQMACAAISTERLIGDMFGSSTDANARIAQLNQLAPGMRHHHVWDTDSDLNSMKTDEIMHHLKQCYARLFKDTMYQIRDAVYYARKRKGEKAALREVLVGGPDPKKNEEDTRQNIDELLRVRGLGAEINNRIDAEMMSASHEAFQKRMGDRRRNENANSRDVLVQGDVKAQIEALAKGADYEQDWFDPTEAELKEWYDDGVEAANRIMRRRIIDQTVQKHVQNACLNDVVLRAGMGFTTDMDGRPIPSGPMSHYIERQNLEAIIGGDETGGNAVINTTQLGDVEDIIGKLYDFTEAIRFGVASDYTRDEEMQREYARENWEGILRAWDRLTNREKGIMMNVVRDPAGGRAPMSPLIGTLLRGGALELAPLPVDEDGQQRIDGKTYVEAFVDHILDSQARVEKMRDPDSTDRSKLFTKSSRQELLDYLSHGLSDDDIATTGDEGSTDTGESKRRMPVWKDYMGEECEPVFVHGIGARKAVRPGEPIKPEDLIESVLSRHSQSKYGEDGRVSPLELIYGHLYDRMQRKDRDPYVDELERARSTGNFEGIGQHYSLADWLNPEKWDSTTQLVNAMGHYRLTRLPGLFRRDRGLMGRWRLARMALEPYGLDGRKKTDTDIMNSKGFKQRYGKAVVDFDPRREGPEAFKCAACGGTNKKHTRGGKQLKSPCPKCMSPRQVRETFRAFDLPDEVLDQWQGCVNPINVSTKININSQSLKLVKEYRKQHEEDTKKIFKAISSAARESGIGIISCPNCSSLLPDKNCETCDGAGTVVDPVLFAKDVLGSFGDGNQYSPEDKKKFGATEKAIVRLARGIRSDHQDEWERKARKGIWGRQPGVPGSDMDRHFFSMAPALHINEGPLSIGNLERLFLEEKARQRVDSDSETRKNMKKALYERLEEQVKSALEPQGEKHRHRHKYLDDIETFMESEHTQAILDTLSRAAKESFPANPLNQLLKRVWNVDEDGYNTHLDDGKFSDTACKKCNGQHCSQCNYTGREGIRMMISRYPGMARYPPRVLQGIKAPSEVDRPLSVFETPIAAMSLGHHPCGTCNHGMAPEFMEGGGHSAHIINPAAMPIDKLRSAAHNGTNHTGLTTLLQNIKNLERHKRTLQQGGYQVREEYLAGQAISGIRDQLSHTTQRDILKELNKNARLGSELDIDRMGDIVRDDSKFDLPTSLSHVKENTEVSEQMCPHCVQLHQEGLLDESKIRKVGQEQEFSEGLVDGDDEAAQYASFGSIFCKNMLEAVQENKAGYGSLSLRDLSKEMDATLQLYEKRGEGRMSEESLRLLHGIDSLMPITEHLTSENLGLAEGDHSRMTDLGGGTLILLPDVRTPLSRTLQWVRSNEPTKTQHLSRVVGHGALPRTTEDMKHESHLFTFLNTLEENRLFPQSKAQDKMLERLYALYVLHPDSVPAGHNILGYRHPDSVEKDGSDKEKMRVAWAKRTIGDTGESEDVLQRELRDHFVHLAPLLELEDYYREFRVTPLGGIRTQPSFRSRRKGESSYLPDSLLDSGLESDSGRLPLADDVFFDNRAGSDLDNLIGLLRIHSVNSSELIDAGILNQDQLGFLTPFEHHPSLEFLLNPNHKHTLDSRILNDWVDHNEETLPEAMKMEGKTWEEILNGRMEGDGISHLSFPGLLWTYATGGHHRIYDANTRRWKDREPVETGRNGGWPELSDLVEDGKPLVDIHLIHFWHYLSKELKLRADNQEGSKRLMSKSRTEYPRINMNEFGTASRCLVCKGAHHGTIPVGLAMHWHPRLTAESDEDVKDATPTIRAEDGSLAILRPNASGQYEMEDPNVSRYIFENLAPFGHKKGRDQWEKVYEDQLRHNDVPKDSAGDPIPFMDWLPTQSAECPSCQGECHCAACSGAGHGEMSSSSKQAVEDLLLATVQETNNMLGLVDQEGHLIYDPSQAEVEIPERQPVLEALQIIDDRNKEMDMQLRQISDMGGNIIGLRGGLEQFKAMNLQDQMALVGAFRDQLGHLFYGDPMFNAITKPACKHCEEPTPYLQEGVTYDENDHLICNKAECKAKEERGDPPSDEHGVDEKRKALTDAGVAPKDDIEGINEQIDELERRLNENMNAKGWFSNTDVWKESQKRFILGGFAQHVNMVQGPEWGEDVPLLDANGEHMTEKGKDGKPKLLYAQKYGYEATATRIGEGVRRASQLLLDKHGKPVMARIPQKGKAFYRGMDNRVLSGNPYEDSEMAIVPGAKQMVGRDEDGNEIKEPVMRPVLLQEMQAFREAEYKRLLINRAIKLGLYNEKGEPDKSLGGDSDEIKKVREQAMQAVKEATYDDTHAFHGETKYYGDRENEYYVPLMRDADGVIHTIMDKNYKWFPDIPRIPEAQMTEEQKVLAEKQRRYRKHLRDLADKGHNRSTEPEDPKKTIYNDDGWDIDGLANGIGSTKTKLHETSSYVRGSVNENDDGGGILGHGNVLGLHTLVLPQYKLFEHTPESIRTKASTVHHPLVAEQYFTPRGEGGFHQKFKGVPENREYKGWNVGKALSEFLGKTKLGGVAIHDARTSPLHKRVHGREMLKRRLRRMAAGNDPGTEGTGVRMCPSCEGTSILNDNLCPSCHGHGVVPKYEDDYEPIVNYKKFNANVFHTTDAGVSLRGQMEDFKDALKSKLMKVNANFEEVPYNEKLFAMIETKLDELMKPEFRIIKPHPGWGASVGHKTRYIRRNKNTGETEIKDPRGLHSGFGDGFLGLHNEDAVIGFIKGINEVMRAASPWEEKYNRYRTLARRYLSEWEEEEEGSVATVGGKPTHVISLDYDTPEDWISQTYSQISKAIKERKAAGDHEQDKGSVAYRELADLRELGRLVRNMTAIKLGMFKTKDTQMKIRQDKDTDVSEKSFQDSPADAVHFVEQNIAEKLLEGMRLGIPFVSNNLPLGHGGDIDIATGGEGAKAKREAYRRKVIGERTVGLAPDDRIKELERVIHECNIGILRHRMEQQPATVSQIIQRHGDPETASLTSSDIQQLCEDLGLPLGSFSPYRHELRGMNAEQLRQHSRDQYAKIREMSEIAYKNSQWQYSAGVPQTIYDFARTDPAGQEVVAPPPEDIQTSFDSPLDSAFFILKNII